MLAFHLVGRPVAQGGMQIVLIEPLDPAAHLLGHFVLVLPLPQSAPILPYFKPSLKGEHYKSIGHSWLFEHRDPQGIGFDGSGPR